MDPLKTVREYYARWLDMDPALLEGEELVQAASPLRVERQEGYSAPLAVYCLFHGKAALLSHSPSLSPPVPDIVHPGDALRLIKRRYGGRLKSSYLHYYPLSAVEHPAERAVARVPGQYEDYRRFYFSQHPGAGDDSWLWEYFQRICDARLCWGIYKDSELVCATDAPSIPFLPDRIAEPGINTLPQYRGRGYAKDACAAFLSQCLAQGKTVIWTCSQENPASRRVALSLGFQPFGELYTVDA